MKTDQFGQIIFSADDIINSVLSGYPINEFQGLTVDSSVNFDQMQQVVSNHEIFNTWQLYQEPQLSTEEFDRANQNIWFMPEEYKQLDIAEYILSLCKTPEELQRVGHELLLYQDRDLFNLLRYLKYLVDVMKANNIIWGVGRGSSVASYVLYLLGVHRVNSMFYDLDPEEFLR